MRNLSEPIPALVPLHPAQVELQQHRLPGSQDQAVGGYLTLIGLLDLNALRRAVAHLPRLFDVFRWQFDPARPDAMVSITSCPSPLELPLTDISDRPDPQREADAWIHQRVILPVATAQHPFFDIHLLRLSDTEHRLVIRGHGLLLDDAGFDAVVAGIANSYVQATTGQKLPQPATPYAHEVALARLYANSMAYAEDEVHWRKQLPEWPKPLLRLNQQRGDAPKTYSLCGSERFSHVLQRAADRLNQPPTYVLMAALTVYFARTNQQGSCVFGRVAPGRQTRSQMPVAGRFDRLLPIRIPYQPGQSLRLLVQTIRRQHRSDNSRRQFPVSHLADGFNTTSPYLFDVLVQHQTAPPTLSLPGLASRVHRFTSAGADVPLHLCWQESADCQSGMLRVSGKSAYISEGVARSLLVQLEHLLPAFAHFPDAPLASVEVLPRFISEYLSLGQPAGRSVSPLVGF